MTSQRLTIFVSHPSHYLTDHAPHGDGLIAYSFLSRLAARGHELHVATPLSNLASKPPPSMHLYPVQSLFAASAGSLSAIHRLEYAFSVRALFKRLSRTVRFDAIHQLNPVVLGVSGLLYHQGVPLVIGPYWPSWGSFQADRSGISLRHRTLGAVKDLTRRLTFLRCDAVLSPTVTSRSEVLESGAKPDSIFHLNVGVDPDAFAPAPDAAAGEPTILFLANAMRRKGIFVLLEAFDLVCERMPNCRLVIGGSGFETKSVEQTVAGMRHSERITLLGHVPREKVAPTLRTCSVYCLPSFGEPFGMSALEAMSCGKPVVVTNKGGLNDLVREQGGLKVSPGDPHGLAAALERILRSPKLQREMGHYNRQLVLREYAWDRILDQLEAIYHELTERAHYAGESRSRGQTQEVA